MRRLLLVLLALELAGCRSRLRAASPAPTPPPDAIAQSVALRRLARDPHKPLWIGAAPGDASGRLYVVEQLGFVRILDAGELVEPPFLDLSARVTRTAREAESEQGLLGLAFHPRFAENRRLFVNFTDLEGTTRIVELRVGGDGRIDPASEREWLKIEQPYPNHNGGHLAFGPDGKLWIGTGDGGSRYDPHGNGQNPDVLLGKMLRLDVDGALGARPEIVQIGLRNPWRYSFDRRTGDLYIADVGQKKYEEVDVLPAGRLTGVNFGWNVVEGLGHCVQVDPCEQEGFTQPVVEYTHDEGCSITGGFVYRGRAIPELDGVYLYADYCSGLIRGFRWRNGVVEAHWDLKRALDPDYKLATISSFGEDNDGELYLVSLDGSIWKLVRR